MFVGSKALKGEGKGLLMHRPELHGVRSPCALPPTALGYPTTVRLLLGYREKATCGYTPAAQLWATQKKQQVTELIQTIDR